MEIFNNREIATAIWMAVAFVAALFNSSIRASLADLVKNLFAKQIIILNILLAAYVFAECHILSLTTLWDYSQIKTTLIWAIFSAFTSIVRFTTSGEKTRPFRDWVADTVKVAVIVEFVVNFYTFPLVVELALLPIVTFLAAMVAYAEVEEKFTSIRSLLQSTMVVIGLIFIGFAARQMFLDIETLWQWSTAQDFLAPPLLSLLFIPFLLGTYWHTAYQRIHTRLDIGGMEKGVRRKAVWCAFAAFRGRVDLAKRWSRDISPKDIHTDDDIRQSINRVLELSEREANPPHVAEADGWSPYLAMKYLADYDLATGDYHQSFDGWFASSPYREIGEGILPNNLSYYVEGTEHVATTLKLILHVNNPNTADESQTVFRACGTKLLECSTRLGPEQALALFTDDNSSAETENAMIALRREDFSGGIKDGYSLRLSVAVRRGSSMVAAA